MRKWKHNKSYRWRELLHLKFSSILLIALISIALLFNQDIRAAVGGFFVSNNSIELSNSLVGHWKLDGDAVDSSSNSNDGTVYGSTVIADRFGNSNSALEFNGTSSDYVNIPHSASLNPTGDTFSISLWFRADEAGSSNASILYNKETVYEASAGGGYVTYAWQPHWAWDGGTSTPFTVGKWHHLVTIYDGTNQYMYLDGVLTYSRAESGNMGGNTNRLAFATRGTSGGGNSPFNGAMDDVRMYDRDLNPAEVKALYEGQEKESNIHISDTQKGLVGHWKFDGELKDSTPYGNNGTARGNASSTGTDRNNSTNSTAVFDGSGDYISHSTNGINSRNGTVTGWVKPSSSSDWGFWQTHDSSGQNWVDWISMFSYTNDNFYFRMGDGSNCCNNDVTFSNSTYITPNEWNHLAFTWSDSIMEAYVDGERVAYRNNPTLQNNVDSAARIGWGHDRQLNGQIDDFRIYNRPLNSNEITKLYESYNPVISVASLQKGLKGHWPFSSSIEVKDSTPYSSNGTITGTPNLVSDRNGSSASAYDFDGSNDYMSFPAGNNIQSRDSFSVSAWFNADALGDYLWWFSETQIWISGDAVNARLWDGSTAYIISGTTTLNTGDWHHVVFAYDGSEINLYLNGVSENSPVAAAGTTSSTPTFYIGRDESFPGGFDGRIDDLRIWNRALTANEVERLYESY